MGFITLLIMVGKKIGRFILQTLDEYRQKVSDDIDQAATLRVKAEQLLKDCQDQHQQSLIQIQHILEHIQAESDRLRQEALVEMAEFNKMAEWILCTRIEQAKARALDDIRAQIANIAIKAASHVIGDTLSIDQDNLLIDDTLHKIKRSVH